MKQLIRYFFQEEKKEQKHKKLKKSDHQSSDLFRPQKVIKKDAHKDKDRDRIDKDKDKAKGKDKEGKLVKELPVKILGITKELGDVHFIVRYVRH